MHQLIVPIIDHMRLLWLAMLLGVAGFSGCDSCYNVACNEPDVEFINGLHFAFDHDSFPFEQVDNATILKFSAGNLEVPLDTIFLKDVITNEDRSFYIAPQANAAGQVDFAYGIYDNTHEYAYIINTISIQGIYPTDCCCCYRNTEKTFEMNGEAFDRTGVTDVVVLRK